MKKRFLKLAAIVLVLLVAGTVTLSAGGQKGTMSKGLPVVGISTGSSGTSWRNIMIDALESVGEEYVAAKKIASYKLVNNVTNGDATEQANILRDFISQVRQVGKHQLGATREGEPAVETLPCRFCLNLTRVGFSYLRRIHAM